jgi:hypothetical protein
LEGKNMNFKGLRVLVLDGYGRQIPSIICQLRELKCHITTISCSKLDPGYASKYPDKKLIYPRFNDAVLKKEYFGLYPKNKGRQIFLMLLSLLKYSVRLPTLKVITSDRKPLTW